MGSQIYETIGIYLGYTLPYYAEFMTLNMSYYWKTSGEGGNIMVEKAKEVLKTEFLSWNSIINAR